MHTGEPKPGLSGLPHPCLFGSDRGAGFVPSIGGCAQGANRHQSRAKRVERGCRRLYRTIPVWRLKRSALFRDRPSAAPGVVASRWPDVNPPSGGNSTAFGISIRGPEATGSARAKGTQGAHRVTGGSCWVSPEITVRREPPVAVHSQRRRQARLLAAGREAPRPWSLGRSSSESSRPR